MRGSWVTPYACGTKGSKGLANVQHKIRQQRGMARRMEPGRGTRTRCNNSKNSLLGRHSRELGLHAGYLHRVVHVIHQFPSHFSRLMLLVLLLHELPNITPLASALPKAEWPGRIRALDEIGLVGTGGIDGGSSGDGGLLGAGGSVVNTADHCGQPAHGKLQIQCQHCGRSISVLRGRRFGGQRT